MAGGCMLAATMGASAQTSAVAATTKPESAPAPASAIEDWIKESKHPASWMTWGADLRLRHETVINASQSRQAPMNEQEYQRFRARVWTAITPLEGFDINARLAWESRNFLYPDEPNISANRVLIDSYELDEVLFDNLNLKFSPKNVPLTLTVGRQDFMAGGAPEFANGWLLGDGTPLDGSRTYFFDAARLTFDWKDCKTVINAIYLNQQGNSDAWLPPINQQDYRYPLCEQDEQGAILYVINRSLPKTQIEGFFIYTHRNPIDYPNHAGSPGLDGEIYAFGLRGAGDIGEHWKYDVAIAPEFGERNDQDLTAFGAYGNVYYNFNDARKNQLRLGVEYLSGDDPSTADYEGFDPLWGRWPQWSELLVYQVNQFGRPCYWSDLIRPHVGWSINPMKKMAYSIDYSALFGPENAPLAGLSDDGNFKGHLLQTVLKYTFNQHVRGHLWAEFFLPGNFYAKSANDNGMFLRAELYMTY
jgi:hypothetical protein